MKLEREGRLDGVALQNPKEIRLHHRLEWEGKEKDINRELQ